MHAMLAPHQLSSCELPAAALALRVTLHSVPCALAVSETHLDTFTVQRAAATKKLRAEVKLVTCAQLSEAGS